MTEALDVSPKISLMKYIGKRYEDYNCFDLVKEFYLDHFKLELSNYFESGQPIPDPDGVASLIISNKGDFVQTKKPRFGDIVVISLYGVECHIGVVVHNGCFLHSIKNAGSCMDRLDRYKKVIAGYYRHKGRND